MGSYDKTIIVIGACGFIGSHIIERLIQTGYDVMAVDNKSTGVFKNIKDFYTEKYFDGNVFTIDKLHQYPKIPIIYHFGMPSSYKMYENNKHLYPYTIKDFLTVLEYCKQWNSKLIYASTASLYWGNSIPFKENMNLYPKDLYSECHHQMERLANLYSLYNIDTIGLRLFNVYGKREEHKGDNASIITQFVHSVSANETPIIYGDGNQTRDFIYVDDAVDAIIKCMEPKIKGSNIFNIGSGNSYSFNEILELIANALDTEVKPVYQPQLDRNYVNHSMADLSKVNKYLNWKPKTPIENGIRNIIEDGFYKGIFKQEELLEQEQEEQKEKKE